MREKSPATKREPAVFGRPQTAWMVPPVSVALSLVRVPLAERSMRVPAAGLKLLLGLREDVASLQMSRPAKLPATPTAPSASKSMDGNDEAALAGSVKPSVMARMLRVARANDRRGGAGALRSDWRFGDLEREEEGGVYDGLQLGPCSPALAGIISLIIGAESTTLCVVCPDVVRLGRALVKEATSL